MTLEGLRNYAAIVAAVAALLVFIVNRYAGLDTGRDALHMV